jgi:hypothetical protein
MTRRRSKKNLKPLTVTAAKRFFKSGIKPNVYMKTDDGISYFGQYEFTGDIMGRGHKIIIKNWLNSAKGPYINEKDKKIFITWMV